MPETQNTVVKRFFLLMPVNLWEWLYMRSKKYDRKPAAEILQILKAEFYRDSVNDKETIV